MEHDTERYGLPVSGVIVIPAEELEARATRSSGPGGQNVNKTSTRIELLWDLMGSRVIDDVQRERLKHKLSPRLTSDGRVRVVVSDTRSQRQNRTIAEERLASLVSRALAVQKPRRKTKPTRTAVERRLSEKRIRGARKRDRRASGDD